MRIRILGGFATLAAAPLLAGCVAPRAADCPDQEAREQVHRLANHVEELTAGFRHRGQQMEEMNHRHREWAGHMEKVTGQLHKFMERVERLEVAVRPGIGDGGGWGGTGVGGGPGDLDGVRREAEELRHHLHEMEQARERMRGELEELEQVRNRLREQVKELEEHRRKLEEK